MWTMTDSITTIYVHNSFKVDEDFIFFFFFSDYDSFN